mgnify:CR=1 FL=1
MEAKIQSLLEAREIDRQAKDFDWADLIRDFFLLLGAELSDLEDRTVMFFLGNRYEVKHG